MAKLKTLAGAPADFAMPVTLKNLQGEDVEIIFTCIGRTLLDWHPIYGQRLTDEANAAMEQADKAEAAKEAAEGEEGKKRKPLKYDAKEVQKNMQDSLARGVALVREVAKGWDLEDEFSDENIKLMIAKFPGSQQQVHQEYHQRILGNRTKN